ncbi:hypothetical protein FCV25MIE_03151 [Fagus crenata]
MKPSRCSSLYENNVLTKPLSSPSLGSTGSLPDGPNDKENSKAMNASEILVEPELESDATSPEKLVEAPKLMAVLESEGVSKPMNAINMMVEPELEASKETLGEKPVVVEALNVAAGESVKVEKPVGSDKVAETLRVEYSYGVCEMCQNWLPNKGVCLNGDNRAFCSAECRGKQTAIDKLKSTEAETPCRERKRIKLFGVYIYEGINS